jgi:hypothetical protein
MNICIPPLLPADEADSQILDLTRRNAELELCLKVATALCHLRKSGFCYINCRCQGFCKCSGLNFLSYADLPDRFMEVVHAKE